MRSLQKEVEKLKEQVANSSATSFDGNNGSSKSP